MECNVTLPPRPPAQRKRAFRASNIPANWTKEAFETNVGHAYPRWNFDIHSYCKHPCDTTKTAVISFFNGAPEEFRNLLSGLVRDDEFIIGEEDIILSHLIGLTTLFEPDAGPSSLRADILFVHGLSGNAVGSWSAGNGKCWPRDFLGKDLHDARVITFGYEARLDSDTSTSQLSDYGQQLISELMLLRKKTEDHKRPLFLIGHSFGGTIINWVLHELSSKPHKEGYTLTLNAVRCAVFFGTPHQGMSVKPLQDLASKRVHGNMSRILGDLDCDSEMLRTLRETMTNLTSKMHIVTCIEQKLTKEPLDVNASYLAVSNNGARIHSANEEVIPIDADHRQMAKFSSRTNMNYKRVVEELQKALNKCGHVSERITLSKRGRQDLTDSLRFPEMRDWEDSVRSSETSSEWLLQSTEYTSWFNPCNDMQKSDPFLWIRGDVGYGKSTLLKDTIASQRSNSGENVMVGSYFFTARGKPLQRTAVGLYRSLLVQILRSDVPVICEAHLQNLWSSQRSSEWTSARAKELLVHFVKHLGTRLVCFIDAMDECQTTDVQDILDCFSGLSDACDKKGTIFRVCISSNNDFVASPQMRRVLDLEQQDGHRREILRYVEHKLQIGPGRQAQGIRQKVAKQALGSFLWAKVVVNILNKKYDTTGGRLRPVEEILDLVPPSTEPHDLYIWLLTQGTSVFSYEQRRICLEVVLGAKRPLSLEEVYVELYSPLDPDARTIVKGKVEDNIKDGSAERTVLEAGSGLVEVVTSNTPTVRFLHESVLDFLESDDVRDNLGLEPPAAFGTRNHERFKGRHNQLMGEITPGVPSGLEQGVSGLEGVQTPQATIEYPYTPEMKPRNNSHEIFDDQPASRDLPIRTREQGSIEYSSGSTNDNESCSPYQAPKVEYEPIKYGLNRDYYFSSSLDLVVPYSGQHKYAGPLTRPDQKAVRYLESQDRKERGEHTQPKATILPKPRVQELQHCGVKQKSPTARGISAGHPELPKLPKLPFTQSQDKLHTSKPDHQKKKVLQPVDKFNSRDDGEERHFERPHYTQRAHHEESQQHSYLRTNHSAHEPYAAHLAYHTHAPEAEGVHYVVTPYQQEHMRDQHRDQHYVNRSSSDNSYQERSHRGHDLHYVTRPRDESKQKDFQHNDIQNEDFRHNDLQKDVFQHEDVRDEYFEYEDLQSEESQDEDSQYEDFHNEDSQIGRFQYQDSQYQDSQYQGSQYQGSQNEHVQNGIFPNDNLQNEVIQNEFFQNENLRNEDFQTEDIQNENFHNADLQNSDIQNENFQNEAFQYNDFPPHPFQYNHQPQPQFVPNIIPGVELSHQRYPADDSASSADGSSDEDSQDEESRDGSSSDEDSQEEDSSDQEQDPEAVYSDEGSEYGEDESGYY